MELPRDLDVFLLEESVWMAVRQIGEPAYDFAFGDFLVCRRPYDRPDQLTAIGRVGAPDDYRTLFEQWSALGVTLVNSPEEHRVASELPAWYPKLKDLTVPTEWFDDIPSAATVERRFGRPVFVKGERQTAKHDPELAIARDAAEFDKLVMGYRRSPILHWQKFCVRQFLELRPVPTTGTRKIRPSFEFRTFWWNGRLVGEGPYWKDFSAYAWSEQERNGGLSVAETAVRRLGIPFLVADIAQTTNGDWVLIECNDGQESGYAGVSPFALWQNVVEIAKGGV